MTDSTHLDGPTLRRAFGRFATGVTIVTARGADGVAVGVTANSFTSVSLAPPLVLWSLAKSALSRDAFEAAAAFAVHVLASDQEDLARRFARSGTDKFAGVGVVAGLSGAPLLADAAAVFECRRWAVYEAGDHLIMVGEVVAFADHQRPPLVFHAGAFAALL